MLGFATFFPAITFATAPNVYGTANFGNGLAKSLSIDVNPAFTTTEVSFALFNGQTFTTYQVDAFDGANLVATQTLTNVAPNFNSGFGIIDLIAAGGITKVTIQSAGAPSVWDFVIDTIAFNQSVTAVVNAPPPPPDVLPPPAPPVRGHLHGHGHGETELVEVQFGDDVNDIRGSVVVVQPTVVPVPASIALLLSGLGAVGGIARRRSGSAQS